jgi:hypothetical protein
LWGRNVVLNGTYIRAVELAKFMVMKVVFKKVLVDWQNSIRDAEGKNVYIYQSSAILSIQ